MFISKCLNKSFNYTRNKIFFRDAIKSIVFFCHFLIYFRKKLEVKLCTT